MSKQRPSRRGSNAKGHGPAGGRSDSTEKKLSSHALWQGLLAVLVIAAAGSVAYFSSFQGTYVFDDTTSIPQNPHIRSLWPIWEAMKAPTQQTADGRPILCLSLAINYRISQLREWSYHLVNLIIHLGTALLLYGIVRRTLLTDGLSGRFTRSAWLLALLCAALWMLHPLNTGSVTYIIQRAESLMGLFYLLTLYLAIRSFTDSAHRRWWQLGAVLACAIGMGCKEVMFTAPIMVLIYDMVFISRGPVAPLRRQPIFYGLLSATWLILIALVAQGPRVDSVSFGFSDLTAIDYAVTQCNVIIHYFKLAFWPTKLALDYDWPIARSFGQYAANGVLLLAILGATVVLTIRRPKWGFLGLWIFLILGPTSSFLPIATEVAAEHRMYLPLIGFIVAATIGSHVLIGRITAIAANFRIPLLLAGLLGAVSLGTVYGTLTYQRNLDYSSRTRIWQDTVDKLPANSRAHHNLGVAMADEDRHDQAIVHYTKAIEIKPTYLAAINHRGTSYNHLGRYREALADFEKVLSIDAHNTKAQIGRGVAAEALGDLEGAIGRFTEAIKSNPRSAIAYSNRGSSYDRKELYDLAIADFTKAIQLDPTYSQAYQNRGATYVHKGDYEKSLPDYTKAIELTSNNADAYSNRGTAYNKLGRHDEALADFSKALALDPKLPEAYRGRAQVFVETKQWAQAMADYDKAIELQPDGAGGYIGRGVAHSTMGNYPEAINDLLKAVELAGDDQSAYNNLALAYRNQGMLDESEKAFTRAIELAPTIAATYNNRGICYGRKSNYQLAIQDFNKALELDPSYGFAYNNRGMAYGKQGLYDLAIADFDKAIELNPGFTGAYINRCSARNGKGDVEGALADAKAAIKINPNYSEAHFAAGRILDGQHRYGQAIKHYRQGLQIRPNSPTQLKELAWILATSPDESVRDGNEAVRLATSACRMTQYKYYWIVDALAAAQAEAGKFDDAAKTAQRALELAKSAQQEKYARDINARIELYMNRTPFRRQ